MQDELVPMGILVVVYKNGVVVMDLPHSHADKVNANNDFVRVYAYTFTIISYRCGLYCIASSVRWRAV